MKHSRLKKALEFISGLLAIVKWLPVGQWRQIAVTLSTIIGVVLGMLSRCENEDTPTQPTVPTSTPSPIPTATPTPTPTPKPTPRPPRILIDRVIAAKHPFTVRYTAPFQYNTHLWADKSRLGYMGKDVDGGHVLYAVVLNTPGKRRLTIRNEAGNVLAEHWVEVSASSN
jgi:hypothetical protein